MRVALVWLVVAVGGCEPDYTNTVFRCDANRACPTGQECAFGRCRRGGAVGEVTCDGVSCTTAQQCCIDGVNPPRCIPAGDTCPGISALCDGIADCQSGDHCCTGRMYACGASCDQVACTLDEDCPSSLPNCCDDPFDDVPWGACELEC